MSVLRVNVITMLVGAVLGVASLVAAPGAYAGTFDVTSCSASAVANPPSALSGTDDAWTFTSNDGHLEAARHCPPVNTTTIDGLVGKSRLNSGLAPQGAFGEWAFVAPG